MQNNDNQTNQNDPHNRGQNGFESISPGLCSIWLNFTTKLEPISSEMPEPQPGRLACACARYVPPRKTLWFIFHFPAEFFFGI